MKATTINRTLDDLRSALAKAVAWGQIEVHPLAGVKRSKSDSTPIVRWLDRGLWTAREAVWPNFAGPVQRAALKNPPASALAGIGFVGVHGAEEGVLPTEPPAPSPDAQAEADRALLREAMLRDQLEAWIEHRAAAPTGLSPAELAALQRLRAVGSR